MLLAMPPGLDGFVPAVLASPDIVTAADTVWVARRIPSGTRDTVEIIGATVDSVVSGPGPAYVRMTGSGNAAVIPGDSGGGVWVNGQLVANLWSGSMVVEQTWFDRLTGSEQVSQTNLINGALNPLGAAQGSVETISETAVSSLEVKLFE
jgi:hypothetical protein